MEIAIGSDHGGFTLKAAVIEEMKSLGHEVEDCGCYSTDSAEYPVFAEAVCEKVKAGACERGILICGTGIGMSLVANRHRTIRAALCHDNYTSRMCRKHNDANILCIGARVTGLAVALDMVAVFLTTEFEGGRHQQRISRFSD